MLRPNVVVTFAPAIYSTCSLHPYRMPRHDPEVGPLTHCVAVAGWDEPLPAEPLNSDNPRHENAILSIARYIIETANDAGLAPVIIAGTVYTSTDELAAAPLLGQTPVGEVDQCMAGLRDGEHTGVILAHVLSAKAANLRRVRRDVA